jgi:hypothetical protein
MCFDLIIRMTRHKQHRGHEFKPECMAFSKNTFETIRQIMKLPPAYLYMRKNMGGSGVFQKYSTWGDDGSVTHLG